MTEPLTLTIGPDSILGLTVTNHYALEDGTSLFDVTIQARMTKEGANALLHIFLSEKKVSDD